MRTTPSTTSVFAFSILLLAGCSAASGSSNDGGTSDSGNTADAGGGTDAPSGSEGGPGPDGGTGGDSGMHADASSDAPSGSDGSSGGDGSITNDWSCLGDEVRSTSSDTTTFTMTFADIASHAPNAGLQVALCATGTLISDCVVANPNNDVDASGTTDSSGKVVLNVTFPNADGYQGIVHAVDPNNAMLDDIIAVNFVADLNLKLDTFTKADVTAAASTTGAIDLSNHALIYGKVLDCSYQPAPGATVTQASLDTTTKLVYYAGGSVSASAMATDASGAYLITNAPFADFGVGWSNSAAMMVGGITPQLAIGAVSTILIPPTD